MYVAAILEIKIECFGIEHRGALLARQLNALRKARVGDRRRIDRADGAGGEFDPAGDAVLAGLTRAVEEETGLVVTAWDGPLYEVRAVAVDMGWQMDCEVHRAVEFDGDLRIDDPDGIVVDALFVAPALLDQHLTDCFRWVRDPLAEWLAQRWSPAESRRFTYEVRGSSLASFEVVSVSMG